MSSASHSSDHAAKAIPSVAYYRVSTDKDEQAKSIPDQRTEVRAMAARDGYVILREYIDEGLSGDEPAKREQFLRLREDVTRLGDFEAVLCWDQDRFLRTDSLETGYWIKPLRDHGVSLVPVVQGRIDWNDFGGRLKFTIEQEGKNRFLRGLSLNVLRGTLSAVREGKVPPGKPPYGYRTVYREEQRGGRRVLKADRWEPAGGEEVKVVRWLFETYATGEWSLRDLGEELKARGVKSPRSGGRWHPTFLRRLLMNAAYVGTRVWNQTGTGRYSEVVGGRVRETTGKRKGRFNPKEEWVVVPAAHEPIVETKTFMAVQELLPRRRGTSPTKQKPRRYLLSGLLQCGHCKGRMIGTTVARKRDGKPVRDKAYQCSNYQQHGAKACSNNSVAEAKLVDDLLRVVQEEFLNPERLEHLRADMRAAREKRLRDNPDLEKQLRAKVRELDRQAETLSRRMAVLGDDLLPDLAKALRAIRADRDRAAAELAVVRDGPQADPDEQAIDQALAKLWTLREVLRRARAKGRVDDGDLRPVLEELVDRVELFFDVRKKKGLTRSPFKGGRAHLKSPVAPQVAFGTDCGTASSSASS